MLHQGKARTPAVSGGNGAEDRGLPAQPGTSTVPLDQPPGGLSLSAVPKEGNQTVVAERVQLPRVVVQRWAREIARQAIDSRSGAIAGRLLSGALTRVAKGNEVISGRELAQIVCQVDEVGESMFAQQFRGGKARSLNDTCRVWALRLLREVSRSDGCQIIDQVESSLAEASAARGKNVELLDLLSDGRAFELKTRQLRANIVQALPPNDSREFAQAIDALLAHIASNSEALNMGYLEAVCSALPRRKRASDGAPAVEIPAADRQAFLGELQQLERSMLRWFLPQASARLLETHRVRPSLGFEYGAHVASCIHGALVNGTALVSQALFMQGLERLAAATSSNSLAAERAIVVQLQAALKAVGWTTEKQRGDPIE